MKSTIYTGLSLILLCAAAKGQDSAPTTRPETLAVFSNAASDIQRQLAESVEELARLRDEVAAEKIPLAKELRDLEAELAKVRADAVAVQRTLDGRNLDLIALNDEVKRREAEGAYVSSLLNEYIANFESRLHIAEDQRFKEAVSAARSAPENATLSRDEVSAIQMQLLETSVTRIEDLLGGMRFEGNAVDPSGIVKKGRFVLVGPVAYFVSDDNAVVGTVEEKINSTEPSIVPLSAPEDVEAAKTLVMGTGTRMPLDPTMGNANKIEETRDTLIEHIKKGGPLMYPIFALAGCALLVMIFKWLSMVLIRRPSKKKIKALLALVAEGDKEGALVRARKMGGPVGAVLLSGVQHIEEPRELIEEIMYEKVMASRLKVQSFLPFIAISATAAPLLGLLGTVTGIMNTFTLMTVFGTGDVKTLSSGISEALITTEYGLLVAIPSLLMHALLSRKAKGIVDDMEKAAVSLVNQISLSAARERVEA